MKFTNNKENKSKLTKMAINSKQQWVLDYLTKNAGRWISPSEVGEAFRKAHQTWSQMQSKSNHSAFGSPLCKSLIPINTKVKRSVKGTYMYDVTGNIGNTTAANNTGTVAPNVKSVTKAIVSKPEAVTPATGKSTEDARIAYNEANGFIRVCILPNGLELYKKRNDAGGWTYYGESGTVFTTLWDECTATRDEFLAIAKDCYGMGEQMIVKAITPTGYKYQLDQLVWYFKNNLVHSARITIRTKPAETAMYETAHGVFEEHQLFPTKESLIRSL
jgi:hypothetical protein